MNKTTKIVGSSTIIIILASLGLVFSDIETPHLIGVSINSAEENGDTRLDWVAVAVTSDSELTFYNDTVFLDDPNYQEDLAELKVYETIRDQLVSEQVVDFTFEQYQDALRNGVERYENE